MHPEHHPARRVARTAPAMIALIAVLITVGTGVAAARRSTPAAARPVPTPTAAAPARPTTAAGRPSVAPLTRRVRADLLVTAGRPLTPAELRLVRRSTAARAMIVVDYAPVRLNGGRAVAVGVDPSTFRRFAPAGTAGVDALWQSVADGEVAVAFDVARSLDVPLGGNVSVGRSRQRDLRVGAFATTGLPGVGVVVAHVASASLGLAPDAAAVISLDRATDAPALADKLRRRLPRTVHVATVQTFVVSRTRSAWVAPAAGRVTSGFGRRIFPLDPTKQDFHPGIDIAAALGAPVWAASAGTVLYAGPAAGFGNEIVLAHRGDVTTIYGHMSRLLVTAGSAVAAGQPIALVGSEGESTGPHLHFEVHVGQRLVDPLAWLRTHGVPLSE